jgi:hypothetical protein
MEGIVVKGCVGQRCVKGKETADGKKKRRFGRQASAM